ncbi:SDR family NAD(P)-dependent oxidoreductase [Pedobacter frigiditerrae]|uniref:SDR family NAD(P)-dependent oxidoreductase n=1 Tax=Pedobacter frigiditerrae TaxID=2530452 RepID=A0A4R0MTV1_9SPHI|nr:oxidoreductase [Pedobacter frigiditerrae]TCC90147.1 SDR family NAD(P)-dependent oxidoreductase [Pedobacter frigiditerrae]
MKKVWFITGSSRGLGRSLTAAVLAIGDLVAATARDISALKDLHEKYPNQLYPLQLDVNIAEAIEAAVTDTIAHFGRIDVLVNNAGFGITGAIEGYTAEQVSSQLQTNLYAPIALTRAVLPYMRKQRSGHILQVSSIGGRVGSGGVSIYQAAKFGLSGFSEGLAIEVAPLGIKVTCIEPGGFRTDWAGDSMTYAPHIEGYETTVDARVNAFKSGSIKPMGDPDKAAKVMIDMVNHPQPPLHLLLGSEAVAIVKYSEAAKLRELEQWENISTSTDADDAENFLQTEHGKKYLNLKK